MVRLSLLLEKCGFEKPINYCDPSGSLETNSRDSINCHHRTEGIFQAHLP